MKATLDDLAFGRQADPCTEWFERAARGDEAAAEHLYDHCVPLLRGWLAMRLPEARAAELAHDALVHAFRKHHLFRPGTLFMPWLRTLAWRIASNQLRDETRERRRILAWIDQQNADSPEDPALDEHRLRALDQCLFSLPPDQRRLVDLHYAQGRTSQSIADELGRSRSAVAVGLLRIRRRLRHDLASTNPET